MIKLRKTKPKTGNVPFVKQWLYIYWNLPFFWTVKIGVTGNYWKRWTDINKDNAGFDIPIFGLPCYFAYDIEQENKSFCSSLQVGYFKGTGRTERFFILAAIPLIMMALFSFITEWAIKFGIVIFIIYTIKNIPDG